MATPIQISVIGDYQAGKSSLIHAMLGRPAPIINDNDYPYNNEEYNSADNFRVNGELVDVNVTDVAPHSGGRGDFGQERHIAYSKSQCVLICMNLAGNKYASDNVAHWKADIERGFRRSTKVGALVPMILVGTMSDLRGDALVKDDPERVVVSREKAEEIAKTMAVPYIETSSVTKEGINDVIAKAIDLATEFKAAKGEKVKSSVKASKSVEMLERPELLKQGPIDVNSLAHGSVGIATGKKNKDCVIL